MASVSSLGTRPTVAGIEPLLEAHLFDFDGDLYGKYLSVELIHYIRPEAKFASVEALIAQIQADAADARQILTKAVGGGFAAQDMAPAAEVQPNAPYESTRTGGYEGLLRSL